LSNTFPIKNGLKQGDALSPLLFNFAFDYAIRRVQANQESLILNCTHQLLVDADDVNILGGSLHAIKNTEALVVISKEIGLEVNVEKTKYMVMSRDQNERKITTWSYIINTVYLVQQSLRLYTSHCIQFNSPYDYTHYSVSSSTVPTIIHITVYPVQQSQRYTHHSVSSSTVPTIIHITVYLVH
jgi:hypothetical protein